MKFLIDNQLPTAPARFFEQNGFEAKHVLEVGLEEARDSKIAEYAAIHDFIIVTKDEDFSVLSALGRCQAPIIWVRLGNCRRMGAFSSAIDPIVERIKRGDTLIELHDM
jgi:predicted nuclease of predicted toxin-antitoxin system